MKAARFRGGRLVLAALAVFAGLARATDLTSAVVTVNGDAVTAREFVESLRRLRARYEAPDQLRAVAQAECIRFKVTQQLALEHGLLSDVSDDALRRAFSDENARRAAALARGEIVYGPKRLRWDQFRATWLDRIELELGRALHARTKGPNTANAERNAFEAALREAIANAKVKAEGEVIARLDPNTPLPVEAGR